MSAAIVEPVTGWEELVRIWEETDAPEGCKVEIIEGIVTVAPPPANDHNDTADELQRVLYGSIGRDVGIYQTQGISLPDSMGIYIPDIVVLPKTALRQPGNRVPAAEALLIAEITSPNNAEHDRKKKLWGYAHADVPLYLLIDPHACAGPTITLYSSPENGSYRESTAVPFGKAVTLPEPFGIVVDTGVFPVPQG
ncbi:Uma2 family endonuclease [Kitasatospora kifunensis]|uniref:Uma2 family endonuclease n=1 Tax=Kitasatospora kifunensis TaxID=58351 RepID=A0A7W7R5B6_KITKI|nr:Uma2 family endonuclease [Kitasatospora kifunensis]MBB4925504.1 Uma2 family endonuclease [Kitasatospora kifunensis]